MVTATRNRFVQSMALATGLVLAVSACEAGAAPASPATGIPSMVPAVTPAPTASTSARPSTPRPAATPSPSATPSEAPSAGWPYTSSREIVDTLFGEDGRVVVLESTWEPAGARIVVLDGDGRPVPGWPWAPGPTGTNLEAAFGPDGSLYVEVRGQTYPPLTWSHALHRLGRDGTEMPGFPVELPAVSYCGMAVHAGNAVVLCQHEDESTDDDTTEVAVVRPDGSMPGGWPVRLGGSFDMVGFGRDGTLYLQEWGPGSSTFTAFARDGSKVAGWPRTVRGEARAQVDDQGRIRVTSYRDVAQDQVCGLPSRTVYAMLRSDGSTARGWPVTVAGWSSEPELADDGSMVVVSKGGRATAYTRRGTLLDGWPVWRVSVIVGCTDGSRPWAAGDGATVIVGDGRLTLLEARGRVAPGWPVPLPHPVARSCPGCTPGPSGPLAPAVGERAVYVGAYRADRPRVMVIERDGSMPSDAQVRIGRKRQDLGWIRIAPTGRVWALLTWWENEAQQSVGALYLVAEDAVPGA